MNAYIDAARPRDVARTPILARGGAAAATADTTRAAIPSVSARPCQNVRDVVPQIRFSARSTIEKTHEPAQSTMTTHVTMTPVPTDESDRIVSRKNFEEAG